MGKEQLTGSLNKDLLEDQMHVDGSLNSLKGFLWGVRWVYMMVSKVIQGCIEFRI